MENPVVLYENFPIGQNKTQVDFPNTNHTCRCAVVCLGLLCAVLLATSIGLTVLCVMNISPEGHNCDQLRAKSDCEVGWMKFSGSCYMVSSDTETWTQSRRDCIAKDADLVTINSRDEQAFVNGLLRSGECAWIGLTDSRTSKEWERVGGTPVTTKFWQPRPSGIYCAELKQTSQIGEWNDMWCFRRNVYICQKSTTNKL